MIRYTLVCDKDHEFEAWFASSDAFDASAKAGANVCPVCGSGKVGKALMAPSVSARTRGNALTPASGPVPASVAGSGPALGPAGGNVDLVAADPRHRALRKALTELRRRVTESADYVGKRFPEEARKIHYEEAEPRGIYGEATPEEARELLEEGVEVLPLPPAPEEKN